MLSWYRLHAIDFFHILYFFIVITPHNKVIIIVKILMPYFVVVFCYNLEHIFRRTFQGTRSILYSYFIHFTSVKSVRTVWYSSISGTWSTTYLQISLNLRLRNIKQHELIFFSISFMHPMGLMRVITIFQGLKFFYKTVFSLITFILYSSGTNSSFPGFSLSHISWVFHSSRIFLNSIFTRHSNILIFI